MITIGLSKIISHIWQRHEKLRFLVVGGYNTVFGYAVFAGCYYLLHVRTHYIFILLLAHFLAVGNAFLAHKFFTFRTEGHVWKEFIRFNLAYLGTLGAGLVGLPFLVEVIGLHPLASQGLISIFTVITSYFLHKRITFMRC